jgi:hypothetical protein
VIYVKLIGQLILEILRLIPQIVGWSRESHAASSLEDKRRRNADAVADAVRGVLDP